MKTSEVAELLTFIAAFDHRTIGQADVMAWASLETIQRADLPTAKRAVIMFFDHEPPDRGPAPYLDPRELKRYIRLAKERVGIEAARESARRALPPAQGTPRPADFAEQVQQAQEKAKAFLDALRTGGGTGFGQMPR